MPLTMADRDALAGCRVWITRPRAQAGALCALVQSAGGEAIPFPLVEIVPPVEEAAARTQLAGVDGRQACIFVSRNAVLCALALQPDLLRNVGAGRVFAVGAGTASELARHGIGAATGPGPAYGAADLLTHPALQSDAVRDRDVLIVRGSGGETVLADTLVARGARVHHAEVYRRAAPAPAPGALRALWQATPPDVIVLTSAEAVPTLVALTPDAQVQRLRDTALVVISPRVATAARNAGFSGVVRVAVAATDTGLLEALLAWRTHR